MPCPGRRRIVAPNRTLVVRAVVSEVEKTGRAPIGAGSSDAPAIITPLYVLSSRMTTSTSPYQTRFRPSEPTLVQTKKRPGIVPIEGREKGMRSASILVVDDDPDILNALSEVMTEEGFVVRIARDGQEALNLVETAPPGLILLDLRMPVMDGREFGTRIRSCPDWANIPIIILSADQNAGSTARDLDAVGYLGKPFELNALLGLVHSVLPPVAA